MQHPGLIVPNYPFDEHGGISERTLDGVVRWKYTKVVDPVHCQRLPDGTTEVASVLEIARVTADGKQLALETVSEWNDDFQDCWRPQRLGKDRYLVLGEKRLHEWYLAEMDRSGRLIRQVKLQNGDDARGLTTRGMTTIGNWWARYQRLRNGNYVITGWADGAIREIDEAGHVVWTAPRHLRFDDACRLSTGNTLLVNNCRVIEVGRNGQVVWEAFSDGIRIQRVWACLNLVRLGFDTPRPVAIDLDKTVAHRIKGLQSKNAYLRYFSVVELEYMGSKAAAAVPALLAASDDSDPLVRDRSSERALPAVCTDASLPVILRAIKDRRPSIRIAVCIVLSQYPRWSQEVVPVLLAGLSDAEVRVRRAAARSLRHFPTEGKVVVGALLTALKDKDPGSDSEGSVAHAAAYSLTTYQKNSREIVPALIAATKSKEPNTRAAAVRALGSFRDYITIIEPVLKHALQDDNSLVQACAAQTLRELDSLIH